MSKPTPETVEPGIYYDLSGDDYHAGPGVSSSEIKLITRSPAHLKAYWETKTERRSKALDFGTAYHTAVLEPERFETDYGVPLAEEVLEGALNTVEELKAACQVRGIDAKKFKVKADYIAALKVADPKIRVVSELKAMHAEVNQGKTEISLESYDGVLAMREALARHNMLSRVLAKPGLAEASIFWRDEQTGVLCKIRPDWIRTLKDGSRFIVDLKSTEDASREGFERSVYNWSYHLSAAMYCEGFKAYSGEDIRGRFVFAAQEKNAPYAAVSYVIDEAALEVGRRMFREGLQLYAECMKTNHWPAYPEQMLEIGMPPWAYRKAQDETVEQRLERVHAPVTHAA